MDLLDYLFVDEEGRLRTIWRFLIFGVGYFLIVVITVIAVTLLAIAWLHSQNTAEKLPASFDHWLAEHMLELMMASALPFAALSWALVVVCRRFLDRRSVASLGLTWPIQRPRFNLGVGTLLGAAPIFLSATVFWLLGVHQIVPGQPHWILILLTLALMVMAFMEEIVVRGYLLQNLVDINRPLWGLLFTSVVFWLLHGQNPHFWTSPIIAINLFAAGIVLGLAYLASGNLWFPTAYHFGWNCAQGVVLGAPISGVSVDGIVDMERTPGAPNWLTGGSFGFEGSVIVTILQVFLILAFSLWILKARRTETEGK